MYWRSVEGESLIWVIIHVRYDFLLGHFDNVKNTTYGVAMSISIEYELLSDLVVMDADDPSHLARIVSNYESSLAKDLIAREKEEERSFGYWTPSVSRRLGSLVDERLIGCETWPTDLYGNSC